MKSPLYITGVTPDGRLLMGGVFRMQDEHGFPVDASHEECRMKGFAVDWLEALCDCWLNDPQKFESFGRQVEMIAPGSVDRFSQLGARMIASAPKVREAENPVDEFCRHILNQKKTPHQLCPN